MAGGELVTAEEHYQEAERLLGRLDSNGYAPDRPEILEQATVHAHLAIAAGLIDAARRFDARQAG